jgi:hypothetical protein
MPAPLAAAGASAPLCRDWDVWESANRHSRGHKLSGWVARRLDTAWAVEHHGLTGVCKQTQ